MKYVIIGSALAGNKGAASMLNAAIQTLTARDPDATFTLLSMYPHEDQQLNEFKNLTILPTKPLFLGAVVNPLSVLYKLLPPLRPILRKQRHIRTLAEADVYLDQGGITFVDGRELFLLYNIASILPGMLVTKKVVKCSQALGPFKGKLNRFCAKLFLPRVSLVLTRGKITDTYIKELGLKNAKLVADYAFAMQVELSKKQAADTVLAKHQVPASKNLVIISPSQVMRKKCDTAGTDYVGTMAQFIDYLADQQYQVVLLPHSAKASTSTHNNDLPVCQDIFAKVTNQAACFFIDEVLGPQELRHIISKGKVLVTSRFHAMVSGLSAKVPVVVIGWNHKYQEVLEMFGLKSETITAKNLDVKSISDYFERVAKDGEREHKQISDNLDEVVASAREHVELITRLASHQD